MKTLATGLLAISAVAILHTGCEMHPASQTVPGYAEKMKKQEEKTQVETQTKEAIDPQAPSYFPPKKD
jgi:hypothetical protein